MHLRHLKLCLCCFQLLLSQVAAFQMVKSDFEANPWVPILAFGIVQVVQIFCWHRSGRFWQAMDALPLQCEEPEPARILCWRLSWESGRIIRSDWFSPRSAVDIWRRLDVFGSSITSITGAGCVAPGVQPTAKQANPLIQDQPKDLPHHFQCTLNNWRSGDNKMAPNLSNSLYTRWKTYQLQIQGSEQCPNFPTFENMMDYELWYTFILWTEIYQCFEWEQPMVIFSQDSSSSNVELASWPEADSDDEDDDHPLCALEMKHLYATGR